MNSNISMTPAQQAEAIANLQIAVAAIGAHLGINSAEAPVTAQKAVNPAPKARKATKAKGKGKPNKARAPKAPASATPAEVPGFIVDRARHRQANREQAAWMRSHGLVPSGQAWEAVSKGERSVKALKALNHKDGLSLPQGKPAQASTAKPAVVAQVSTQTPAKQAPAKNRAEAARVSAEAKPRVNGQFIRADLAPTAERLRAAGLSEAEVAAALAALV